MRRLAPFLAFTVFVLTALTCIARMPVITLPASVAIDDTTMRMAEHMQERIVHDRGIMLPVASIASALQTRDRLLRSSIVIRFDAGSSSPLPTPAPWTVRVADHLEWIAADISDHAIGFTFDERAIAFSIDDLLPAGFPRARDAAALQDAKDPQRLIVSGVPHAGFQIDPVAAASTIARAINARQHIVTLALTYDSGHLFAQTGNGIRELTVLSTGRSNFANSPPGRAANVVKALGYLNGYVVPAGSVFSFNRALADSSGWYNSLIIVNGQDLVEAPGGGICQAATTAFRAAVLAGLPVTARANHSLYVSHYRDYGVGIDATVMPGQQDLKMVNDSGHLIIILARADGNDAFVDFYGTSDGRSVTLDGPYFGKTAPQTMLFNGNPLHINEIGWRESVQYQDGHIQRYDIVSHYTALPRTLAAQYPVPRGKAELSSLNETGADIAAL